MCACLAKTDNVKTPPAGWSKADIHIHSDHSDGLVTVREILEHVQAHTDLRVIAITDHNSIESGLLARSLADQYDFEVIVGAEVSSTSGHILGLFMEEDVPPRMSAADTIAAIEEQGGVAIVAHPFANRLFGPLGLQSVGNSIHELGVKAVEIYNASPHLVLANRVAASAFQHREDVALTGGSDAHMLQAIGSGYTLFRGRSAEDLRASIDRMETCARSAGPKLSLALRYAVAYPRIRKMQALNWERCRDR